MSKLRDEAAFLHALPTTLQHRYPRLLHHGVAGKDGYYLEEEFVELSNLRDQLLSGSMSTGLIQSVLGQLLEWTCHEVYQPLKYPAPPAHVDEFYYRRVVDRLRLAGARSPVLARAMRHRFLTINDVSYVNATALLAALQASDSLDDLVQMGFVAPHMHGDLHLQNVLVSSSGERVVLVDPRGYRHCDMYYDLGKLEHSLNGKYDLIHEGRYTLTRDLEDLSTFELSFTDQATFDALSDMSRGLWEVYAKLDPDGFAASRVRFAEAMHFCADVPFHLRGDGREDTALAIYLKGVQLLNEFAERYAGDVL